jgi:2-polyprenyl-3-methyl-5-hydroxy-6-metoxy-1,4-benzoquinol methylase
VIRYDRAGHLRIRRSGVFARYQQMRQRGTGPSEDLEQPALTRLLTAVAGRDVLDIGCGDGALARSLASRGARHVLGIDPSERMLTLSSSATVRHW